MLKLRTKTVKTVPAQLPLRGTVDIILRIIIDKIEIDKNGITPKGYYYYLNENGLVVKLCDIGPKAYQLWDVIIQIENNQMVAPLASSANLYENVMQRLEEFFELQQQQETGQNYGTLPGDWEADINIE